MADQFLPSNFDFFVNNFAVPTHHLHPFGSNIVNNHFPRLLDQSQENSDSFNGLCIHDNGDRKRKSMEIPAPANSCPEGSENGIGRKNCGRRGKRAKGNGEEEDAKREVIHVRARRGQATDSHSLAERVRRGKINERLRCLQEIVPGCYKTMGMAVMFDEIINYVQSLQNQVEFRSMKLAAASAFHDFNSETDTLEIMQRAKAFEPLSKVTMW